jgi:hypothetical protein
MYQRNTSSEALLQKCRGLRVTDRAATRSWRLGAAVAVTVLCAGMIIVTRDVTHTSLISRTVALDNFVSVPLSLAPEPDGRRVVSNLDPSRAVSEVQKLLMHVEPTHLRMRFKLAKGPELYMNDQYIDIGGKKFLRTTLLDAVWDYHESPDAKALVNQVAIRQNIHLH